MIIVENISTREDRIRVLEKLFLNLREEYCEANLVGNIVSFLHEVLDTLPQDPDLNIRHLLDDAIQLQKLFGD